MDIASWFVDSAALAAIIAAVIAFIKTNVYKLEGFATVAASLVLGAGFGALGHFTGQLTAGLPAAIAFGVGAGFLAAGGWDVVKGLSGKATPPGE